MTPGTSHPKTVEISIVRSITSNKPSPLRSPKVISLGIWAKIYRIPAMASIFPLGPKRTLGVNPSFIAVWAMISFISPGVKSGFNCNHWAIIPATVGVAIEVPLINV